MTFDFMDTTLWLAGIGMEMILIGVLLWKGIYRELPVFFVYLLWCVCDDSLSHPSLFPISPEGYLRNFVVSMTMVTLFQLAVWTELVRVVLDHNNAKPPKQVIVFLLLVFSTMLVWCIAQRTPTLASPTVFKLIYVHLRKMRAIFMVALLLTSAWLSRILGLHWPERELQVATGFGFSFIVALIVMVLQTHPVMSPYYNRLDQIEVASYIGAAAYWVLCFARYDAKERKSLPQG